MVSPFDENWMLDAEPLERLAVEIRINDPRTRAVPKSEKPLLPERLPDQVDVPISRT